MRDPEPLRQKAMKCRRLAGAIRDAFAVKGLLKLAHEPDREADQLEKASAQNDS